jgi:hypothetical protein
MAVDIMLLWTFPLMIIKDEMVLGSAQTDWQPIVAATPSVAMLQVRGAGQHVTMVSIWSSLPDTAPVEEHAVL